MKPLIVANWKMNPQTLAEAKRLFNSIKNGVKNIKNAEVVICPSFIYLPTFRHSNSSAIKIGGQSCFWEEQGSFTGEVSPIMLKDLGVEYVILGHSERRKYQKETDEMINKKMKAAVRNNLKPILCVENVLQVKRGLRGISKEELRDIVIAYEPVFAIGTGKPCNPEKAEKMRKAIKKTINADIPILYGGSVNSQNAGDYLESRTLQKGVRCEMRRSLSEQAGFQGLLVGGASLNAGEFVKIIKNTVGS